jgi:AcrR family transcriptional regulator
VNPDRAGDAVAQRAVRREELLDAADRVICRDGPAASMAQIAAEAGITKPILYRHFGDKGGLYVALTERYTGRLLVELRTALDSGQDRRDRVERTVRAYLGSIDADREVYRFLTRSDEGLPAHSHVLSFRRRLAGLLADGIAVELGVPASRASAWAHGIVGMVESAGDWWLESRTLTREELVTELSDLLFGAYAGAGSPSGTGPGPSLPLG